jgi:hypothetical protein
MPALRALLAGLVDYAGLYPPASLDMQRAVAEYVTQRAGAHAWMLGRFVAPAAALADCVHAVHGTPGRDDARLPLPVSAVLGQDLLADVALVHDAIVARGAILHVDSIEARVSSPAELAAVATARPPGTLLFAEVPTGPALSAMLDAVAQQGVHAKIRTGGVTPAGFPGPADIVVFMRGCLDRGIAFKATAGLHHPLRGQYRLTYEPGATTHAMYGYLNVFLAATLLRAGGSDDDAVALLCESDPAALVTADGALGWRTHRFSEAVLHDTRRSLALSFGSCSFREPVDELTQLGLRP